MNDSIPIKDAELLTKLIEWLAYNHLTVKQGCDLLDKAKLHMMNHTKIMTHNFNDPIKEAVILEQTHQEVKF